MVVDSDPFDAEKENETTDSSIDRYKPEKVLNMLDVT
jgi:hypothetical protein